MPRSGPILALLLFDSNTNAAALKDYFPMPGETEKTTSDQAYFARKQAFRTNFLTQLKKCAMFAYSCIEKDIVPKYDPTAKTMLISGPAVKKAFGQEQVYLDEKKTVKGPDGKPIELLEKPSFQAVANLGAASAGAAPVPGGGEHRGAQGGTVGGTLAKDAAAAAAAAPTGKEAIGKAVETICKTLQQAIEKLDGKLSKSTRAALEETQNAIEVVLENG